MSLIHKALKKAEKKTEETINDDFASENEFEKNKSEFMSFQMTPRTIVLLIFVVLAGAFAIYINFFKDKGPQPAVQPLSQAMKPMNKGGENRAVQIVDENVISEGVTDAAPPIVQKEMPIEAKNLEQEAKALFMNGKLDGSLLKFNEALEAAPNSPQLLNSIGLVYKKLGNIEMAEKSYRDAIKYDSKCTECYNNLGVLEADKGDNVSAVLYFKKSIGITETYADPYFNLATIMEKEGNFKSAVDNYKKFLVYTTTDNQELKKKIRDRIEDLVLSWEE